MSKTNENQPKKKRKTTLLSVIAVLLAIVMVSSVTVAVLSAFDVIDFKSLISRSSGDDDESSEASGDTSSDDISSEGEFDMSTPYVPPTIDAEEYYNKNGTVKSSFTASTSSSIHSGSEAYNNLVSRGFNQNPVIAEYSIQGEYIGETEVSGNSYGIHPTYRTFYTSASGIVWSISEINGTITATPVTYNYENASSVPITLSETDTITSYDGPANKFFVYVPNSSLLVIKKVTKIDAATLDSFTKETLDRI